MKKVRCKSTAPDRCEHCGAYLDAGEPCDCEAEEEHETKSEVA